MSSTATVLYTAAELLNHYGLHTGDHFASTNGHLDINAAIFRAVTGSAPNCFLDNDDRALLLIQTNEPAMEAIRALSAALPTEPPTDPETGADDYIEHLAGWATTAPIGHGAPPTELEVIGVIVRAANGLRRTALAA
ncbi:hypothetical protein ACFRCX_30775 [Streptomyces sp. NPDC056652]|uniref:DUF6197 family protein n=1 Tax=Streptomyces sp. NPDC056652 TaxID=3345893 RepID=UPI0036BBA27D